MSPKCSALRFGPRVVLLVVEPLVKVMPLERASLVGNSWTPEPASLSLGRHAFHGVLSYNMQPSNNEASGQPDTSETGSQSQSFLLVGCLAPPSQWQKLTCCISVILFPLQLLGNMQTGFAFSQEFSLTVIILLEIFCLTQEVRISY